MKNWLLALSTSSFPLAMHTAPYAEKEKEKEGENDLQSENEGEERQWWWEVLIELGLGSMERMVKFRVYFEKLGSYSK